MADMQEGQIYQEDTSQPSGDKAIEKLDPNGDLLLIAGPYQLLVSSKVLDLSSSFFRTMLRSNAFQEGIEQPNPSKPPVKKLDEDHPDIFLMICRALHYLPIEPLEAADDFRSFADLCHFYGCDKALSVHASSWIGREMDNFPTDTLQVLLWFAFVFRLSRQFQSISVHLARAQSPSEWKAWEVHPMPAQLKEDMRDLCERLKDKVQQQVEQAIDAVAANENRHVGKRDKVCALCFRNKPLATKRCGHCGSNDFVDYVCSPEIRLSLFKGWLQVQGYWPLSRLKQRSLRSYSGTQARFLVDTRTVCGLDDSCPLTTAKVTLLALFELPCVIDGLVLEHYHPESLHTP
ncbi:hypothetical protein DV738_g2564, partial [Chaetothyriales sp. CBS 135597]